MKEKLVSFETAKLAKEKGFDFLPWTWIEIAGKDFEEMLGKISNTDRKYFPTQSLLQKWLREVHNIHISTIIRVGTGKYRVRIDYKHLEIWKNEICGIFNTYEEALEKGLQEALIQKIP